jgi:DNA-binding transcriptional MerR regulator
MTKYVTTGKAADEIGVSAETLRRWVAQGLVKPAFRTPNRGDMRWDVDDLRRQLTQREEPPSGSGERLLAMKQ